MKKLLVVIVSLFFLSVSVFSTPNAVSPADEINLVNTEAELLASVSGTCGENLMWTLDAAGMLTISGNGDMIGAGWSYSWNSYKASIKKIIIKNSVTSIGDRAFENCTALTSVTIPDSVTSIGDRAFGNCTALTSVTIPDSVIDIGSYAFFRCYSITSVEIPHSVTSIGDNAFDQCNLLSKIMVDENNEFYSSDINGILFDKNKTTLIKYPQHNTTTDTYIIPDSVITIGESAFFECWYLKNITIPVSVLEICDYAFQGCSLQKAEISENILRIGEYAFRYCQGLSSITVDENNTYYASDNNGVLFDKQKITLIQYPSGKTEETYTIPDSVIYIGSSAFDFCEGLTNISIPESVEIIGDSAFNACKNLNTIIIPDSVIDIGDNAFFYTAYYNDNNNWKNDVLYISNHLVVAKKTISGKCSIKDGIVHISDNAFYSCTNLTSVIIPDSVTNIGDMAFWGCKNLASVKLPSNISSISNNAFTFCEQLTNITIPDGVSKIGSSAFSGCTNLRRITIPKSVTYISDFNFSDSKSLTIYGYIDSYAQAYANEHNIPFVDIENLPPYTPGELNSDGVIDMNDAILLLQHSMFPSLYPLDYAGDVDFNKDGAVDMNDAILLLQHSMFPSLYPID